MHNWDASPFHLIISYVHLMTYNATFPRFIFLIYFPGILSDYI